MSKKKRKTKSSQSKELLERYDDEIIEIIRLNPNEIYPQPSLLLNPGYLYTDGKGT